MEVVSGRGVSVEGVAYPWQYRFFCVENDCFKGSLEVDGWDLSADLIHFAEKRMGTAIEAVLSNTMRILLITLGTTYHESGHSTHVKVKARGTIMSKQL